MGSNKLGLYLPQLFVQELIAKTERPCVHHERQTHPQPLVSSHVRKNLSPVPRSTPLTNTTWESPPNHLNCHARPAPPSPRVVWPLRFGPRRPTWSSAARRAWPSSPPRSSRRSTPHRRRAATVCPVLRRSPRRWPVPNGVHRPDIGWRIFQEVRVSVLSIRTRGSGNR